MKRNLQSHNGIWLLDITSLALAWSGSQPVPKPTAKERIRFANALYPVKGKWPEVHRLHETVGKGCRFLFETVAYILVGETDAYYRTIHRGRMG